MEYTLHSKRLRWCRNRRGRFFTDEEPVVTSEQGRLVTHQAVLVPSRGSEANVCEHEHSQGARLTGRVIPAGQKTLVLVDVAPCDICPHLDRWDTRIAGWATAHPKEYTKSVLVVPTTFSGRMYRPAEWALQEGIHWRDTILHQFPWDIEEMRGFLDEMLDSPPLTNLEKLAHDLQTRREEN